MHSIVRRFILTTIIAVFASQASAMFISPDPMDPTKPGVGTNRYAYSLNDPINRIDPSGYDSVWSNGDGTWSSSDGSTYDPSNPENNTYDLGSDHYGYTIAPGYSPPELPGVQTLGNFPNVPSSGRTAVITVTSRDYNNPGGPDISRSALHDRTSVFDTGINSYTHQELEREVYNAAGGPGYVGPRMLAIGVGSLTAPIVMSTAPTKQ